MKAIVLVGEMGAGKSTVGRRLAKGHGYDFVEGDDLAGPEMAAAIKDLRRITTGMVDDLVERMVDTLYIKKASGVRGVVLSQALYRKHHRDNLEFLLSRAGIEVQFIWVKPRLRQHIRQLLSRDGGWRWVAYWLLSKPFFQRPRDAFVYDNKRLA